MPVTVIVVDVVTSERRVSVPVVQAFKASLNEVYLLSPTCATSGVNVFDEVLNCTFDRSSFKAGRIP